MIFWLEGKFWCVSVNFFGFGGVNGYCIIDYVNVVFFDYIKFGIFGVGILVNGYIVNGYFNGKVYEGNNGVVMLFVDYFFFMIKLIKMMKVDVIMCDFVFFLFLVYIE